MEFNNKRADERVAFHHVIEFILGPDSTDEIFKGVTIDRSRSGLGLYVFNRFTIGQEIIIKKTLPSLQKKGMIRWRNKIDDDIYRVGLMFQ